MIGDSDAERIALFKSIAEAKYAAAAMDVNRAPGGKLPQVSTIGKEQMHSQIQWAITQLQAGAGLGGLANVPPCQKEKAGYDRLQTVTSYYLQRNFAPAAVILRQIAEQLVGEKRRFPQEDFGLANEGYSDLDEGCRILMMRCCHILADVVSFQTRELSDRLTWLEEVMVVVKNRRYRLPQPHQYQDWMQFAGVMMPLPTALSLVDCLLHQAEVFIKIGNSSAYQHVIIMALRCLHTLFPMQKEGPLWEKRMWLESRIEDQRKTTNAVTLRHPDPKSDTRYVIMDPTIQIQGAWKKLPMTAEKVTHDGGRSNSRAFIWRGYIYVVDSQLARALGKRPRPSTIRRINLKRLDKWEDVAKYPAVRGENILNDVCILDDKMYTFVGHPIIDVFNLVTRKWTILKTTYKSTLADRQAGLDSLWPWALQSSVGTNQHIIDNQLFVFGGLDAKCLTGSNLLMVLDLKTLKWRRLGGIPHTTKIHDPRLPGPRSAGASWVSQDKKRIFVYSGVCMQERPLGENKNGPPGRPWTYDDLWSWDIKGEKWREEKIYGNFPAPRADMGYLFSTKLDRLVVFGGLNQTCFAVNGDSEVIQSIFYADTFMWNPPKDGSSSTMSKMGYWQQVQTIGFPTYRCSCRLLEDPDTGNIYLYGGMVEGDTIPSKNHTENQRRRKATYETPLAESYSQYSQVLKEIGMEDFARKSFTCEFEDLWRFHVDVPGGNFECINVEDEMRAATLGPWQRCFQCRQAGFWKKCGGSCDGKVFFCSLDCQAKGWSAHKKFHGCKKRDVSDASNNKAKGL